MKPFPLALLLVAACTGSDPGANPAPSVPGKANPTPTPTPTPAATSGFVAATGWDGPEVTASRPDANAALQVSLAAPTAGYTFTLDAVVVKDGAREVQVTLLQPPADAQVGRVVTELDLQVEAGKLAGKEPLAIAVRQMQDGCHYLVAPPWRRALVAAK
jgi:hypothetical protein